MLKRLQPKAVPKSNAPFSQVVIDDRYVYLSGLVAADFPTGQCVLGDIRAETRAVLDTVRQILEEVGIGMHHIVRVDVHLANLGDFDAMDEAYRSAFEEGRFPARTTTESARLFGGSLVEVTCQARL